MSPSSHCESQVYCTYPFCPPEGLPRHPITIPSTIDAYSIGATLYYLYYRNYLFDCGKYRTAEDVQRLFRETGIKLPTTVSHMQIYLNRRDSRLGGQCAEALYTLPLLPLLPAAPSAHAHRPLQDHAAAP